MSIMDEIEELKKKTDSVILAHYYVDGLVQEVADYVGDSYFLAKKAKEITQKNIIFCGVSFMGESAKLLNPTKHVYMADASADCQMAHMVDLDKIDEVRKEYPEVTVVCYVNSTAEIKAKSDVCVTSSNALKICEKIPGKDIFFIPDQNLARFIADKLPQKHFIFNDGFCHVHHGIRREDINKAKEIYPDALVLTHPECRQEICEISDFVGSTSEIIEYATKSNQKEFIVCTEIGVFYELKKRNPDKLFHQVKVSQICPNMKKVTLEKVKNVMLEQKQEVILSDELMKLANFPLEKMIEIAK